MFSPRFFSLLGLGGCALWGAMGRANAAPLTNATMPSLSPDGKRLVFVRRTAGGHRLYVANRDGSSARLVGRLGAKGPISEDIEPCWRGDGRAIVFASNRGGNYDLFVVAPNGRGLKQITHTPGDEMEPQWSPRPYTESQQGGGNLVERSKGVFSKSDLQLLQQLAGGAPFDKYEANMAGAYPYKATQSFYRILCSSGKSGQEKLTTLRADGKYRFDLLAGTSGGLLHPRWERSGTKIAFTRRVANNQEALYTANVPVPEELYDDGKHPADLVFQTRTIDKEKAKFGVDLKAWRGTFTRRAFVSPLAAIAWTPNGEFLAVASDRTLRLVRADDRYGRAESGERAKLVAAASGPTLSFGPDGRTALVAVRQGATFSVVDVTLREPLLDVVNWLDFAGWYDTDTINKADRTMLARNSFMAAGAGSKQMYSIYENADYSNLPVFVSSDSLLHLNHLVFDYVLRSVESDQLMPAVLQLANFHLQASLRQYTAAPTPELRVAALSNVTYWSIAARLALGETLAASTAELPATPATVDSLEAMHQAALAKVGQARLDRLKTLTAPLQKALAGVPASAKAVADQELALIRQHKERAVSPLFGGALAGVGIPGAQITDTRIDYTDFQPRGHYTRTEILKRYFLTTRWLADAPLRPTEAGARQALLMLSVENLSAAKDLRRKITRIISEFVGDADDLTLDQYQRASRAVYGTTFARQDIEASGMGMPVPSPVTNWEQLQDETKLKAFVTLIQALPKPRIAGSMGAALRVLPQPYTFDSEVSQNLIYDTIPPDVGTDTQPRYFALGLDVMGVLGSDRARQILDRTTFQGSFFDFNLKETQYAHYDAQFQAQRAKVAAMPPSAWTGSLYARTMWALKPLLAPQPDPRYRFTKSPAWVDKQLNTSLATWAELKHDTLPKQPVAVEAGDGAMLTEVMLQEQPVGFVEPSPAVYSRLCDLVKAERGSLQSAGYLSPDLGQRLGTLDALLGAMMRIEAKQSAGQALSPVEVEQLRFYGTFLEHLTLATLEGQSDSLEDTDMAIIADVASAFSTRLNKQLVLQEGVGHALPVFVAVERGGKRVLTQGAIFTYYEFTQPAADRLTDAQWQKFLASAKRPQTPAWTSSFISTHREASQ